MAVGRKILTQPEIDKLDEKLRLPECGTETYPPLRLNARPTWPGAKVAVF